ncbi:unnamed protein product [Coffea canephora]|uniref:Helicase C-terminal domain-containing protein n=1 Tax=Coffea canephora TaxID=49390 RepID=A0A068UIS7_COFCA|nr:unnamed protein product [Coffea canephora]
MYVVYLILELSSIQELLCVINFEMPQSAVGYVHRIGHTRKAYNTGASVSLVSSEENDMFEDIKSIIGESDNMDSNFIAPFLLLTKNAMECLRYRSEVNIAFLYCIVSCNFLNLLCVKHLFMLTLLLWFFTLRLPQVIEAVLCCVAVLLCVF